MRLIVLLALLGLGRAGLPAGPVVAAPYNIDVACYVRRFVKSWNNDLVKWKGVVSLVGEPACREEDEYGSNNCRVLMRGEHKGSLELNTTLAVAKALEITMSLKLDKYIYLPLTFEATCKACDADCTYTPPFSNPQTITLPKCEDLVSGTTDIFEGNFHGFNGKDLMANPIEMTEMMTGSIAVKLAQQADGNPAGTPVGLIEFEIMPPKLPSGPRTLEVIRGSTEGDMRRSWMRSGPKDPTAYVSGVELWIDEPGVCRDSDEYGSTDCTLEWGREYTLRTKMEFNASQINDTTKANYGARVTFMGGGIGQVGWYCGICDAQPCRLQADFLEMDVLIGQAKCDLSQYEGEKTWTIKTPMQPATLVAVVSAQFELVYMGPMIYSGGSYIYTDTVLAKTQFSFFQGGGGKAAVVTPTRKTHRVTREML
eukprot:Hpha_TRINITY_DN16128_c0_g1::TRINITY_DN16128_c0_g1_i1::g.3425::m.3425